MKSLIIIRFSGWESAFLAVFWVIAVFGLSGCSPAQYKAEADEEVYGIIDNKWQDSFGQKANYKVNDAAPSPNDIQSEKAVPPSGVLSLAQAVAMATTHNRQYQRRKEGLYLSALSLTGERYKYALRWFGTIESQYTSLSESEDGDIGGREDEVEVGTGKGEDGGVGFGQKLLFAGGTILNYGLSIDWLRYLTGDPRTSLGSVLIASVTVPLLGSGAGKVDLEDLTLAERRVLYDIRTFNRFRKEFVVNIVNAYYGVLQQRDAVTNAENNYKRVVESRERLEMEAKAGRGSRIDVDEAEQKVLRAQNTLVTAKKRYEQSLDSFKTRRLSLSTDTKVELDQNELKALEEIGIGEADYTLDTAIEAALLQRLDLANSADRIDDALRNVVLAADGLGPQLNLTGGMNVNSREKTDFSQLQFHEGAYTAGFDADLPFDRKLQRNSYRQALIDLEESQRTYDEFVDDVELNVRDAYRDLAETVERYKIQKNSLTLAEQRVEINKLLLDAGKVTVRVVLESQDDLLDAQNDVTAALVDHLDAKLSFYRDVGILQVRPDGMWEQR